jgi:hypothetical protein
MMIYHVVIPTITQDNKNKRIADKHPCPHVGFELIGPVFEQTNRINATDRAANLMGRTLNKKRLGPLVYNRTIPTLRQPQVSEVGVYFLRVKGCRVVSATGPHSC